MGCVFSWISREARLAIRLCNLAELLAATNRASEAEPLLRRALVGFCPLSELFMHPGQRVLVKFAAQSPKTYPALRDFVEKERPDWLQALMPRRINAPSDYWPQKVLALATIQAAVSNQLMKDAGLKLDLTFGAVEGQTAKPFEHWVRFQTLRRYRCYSD